jgi:exoribonuclease R
MNSRPKSFFDDVFDGEICISSPTRMNKYIPGILDTRFMYGKENKKMLYLCHPDNKELPDFYVAYQIPPQFEKKKLCYYVTFEFKHWNLQQPMGTLTQNFGSIDVLENSYDYLIYCKSLQGSLQLMQKEALKRIPTFRIDLPLRRDRVFTIDGPESVDLDDGFSIDAEKKSIYISLVPYVLEKLELTDCLLSRVSNIYFPEKRVSMLHTIVASLCSLHKGCERPCLVLDLYHDGRKAFQVAKVIISDNFHYEEERLIKDKDYRDLLTNTSTKDSHELVTMLMKEINAYSGSVLKKGIHLNIQQKDKVLDQRFPDYFMSYSEYSYTGEYAQVSSPIRRLVDIMNMTQLCIEQKLYPFHPEVCLRFYDKLDNLNQCMRNIKQIQSKTKWFHHLSTHTNNTYDAIVYSKEWSKSDWKYTLYLPSVGNTCNIHSSNDYEILSEIRIKPFLFMDEYNLKKKVRFQIE